MDALVICLDEFDPSVKEAAAWALGYIARHNTELAQAVVDAGAVPLLILCVQVQRLGCALLVFACLCLSLLVVSSEFDLLSSNISVPASS